MIIKEPMDFDELVRHFDKPQRQVNGNYRALCPCHYDKDRSLMISRGDNGKNLIYCQAGCETKDILEQVGLAMADLNGSTKYQWPDRMAQAFSHQWGEGLKLTEYPYTDERGEYIYSKVRFEGGNLEKKQIRFAIIDQANDSYTMSGVTKELKTLYHLPKLLKAIEKGFPVYIVEGEKDVHTLEKLGLTATTAGAAKDWQDKFAPYFTGARAIILPDNDEPGQRLADIIKKSLRLYAHAVKAVTVSSLKKGDVTDFMEKESGTAEALKEMISEEPWTFAPWYEVDEKGKKHLNADLLADAVKRTVPLLIVRQESDNHDDVRVYSNGIYRLISDNSLQAVIRKRLPIGDATAQAISNAKKLLLSTDRTVSLEDLNRNEDKIIFQNGVLDIKKMTFGPHDPALLATVQINADYDPAAKSMPTFEKYMDDLCTDDETGAVDDELKAVLQEYGGLILSNVAVYRTKKALCLASFQGNSGKSQLLSLLGALIGNDQVENVSISAMNNDSKFAFGNILGKRLILIGDESKSEIKDSSAFKQITGGDRISLERKYHQPVTTTFRGGIVLACNNLPAFTDDKGSHIFERLEIVPCKHHIPPEGRDPFILDKMLREKSAIVNWFLEGLQRLITLDFKFTESVAAKELTADYRKHLDTLYRFISEEYTATGNRSDMVSASDFANHYKSWCMDNECQSVAKNNLARRMEALGFPKVKANIDGKRGVMVFRCLKKGGSNLLQTSFSDGPWNCENEDNIPFD